MFAYLVQGITLGFSAVVSPGPFQAYLLAQATAHGWRKTLPAAFAPLLSDGPIILLVLLVLSRTPDWFLRFLNIAGGLFLLYLAYGAFRTFRSYRGESAGNVVAGSLGKAVLANFLAPGPWLYWSVLAGPILVEAWGKEPLYAAAFLLGFYGLLIGGNIVFILLLSSMRHLGANVTRALNGIAAGALLVFGVIELARGIL